MTREPRFTWLRMWLFLYILNNLIIILLDHPERQVMQDIAMFFEVFQQVDFEEIHMFFVHIHN